MWFALGGARGQLCVDAAVDGVKPPHALCLCGKALNKPHDKMRGLTVSDTEATEICPPPPQGLRAHWELGIPNWGELGLENEPKTRIQ